MLAAYGLVKAPPRAMWLLSVTLPGVKDLSSGLLPDELDTIEDIPQTPPR